MVSCILFLRVRCVCVSRQHARKLALENEALHDHVRQTEKDTVDVFGFLKGQEERKDEQVSNHVAVNKSFLH